MTNHIRTRKRPSWQPRFKQDGGNVTLTKQQAQIRDRWANPDSLERRESTHRLKIKLGVANPPTAG